MDADLYKQAGMLFEQCVDLDPTKRAEFLQSTCPEGTELRTEVEAMLRFDAGEATLAETTGSARAVIDSALTEQSSEPALPESIGRFKIIREIGRGGMGVVYEAEQDEPRRRVALKVVPELADPAIARRMRDEAQTLAIVETPGVARIYETGSAVIFGRRTPYIAMELVDGNPVDEWCRGLRTPTQRLELIARVADAVQAAHARGVIHRDLKPGNILVAPSRDGIGQPKVLDFGIAHAPTAQTLATRSERGGGPIGTLGYMSPEQLGGDHRLVDARSDVYGLGAVAYASLAGRPPYDLSGRTFAGMISLINGSDPPPLGTTDRSLRGDVQVVVAKAMHKEPSRRYQTAEALAADLRRISSNQPILARRPGVLYTIGKFARRHRAATAAAVIFTIALVSAFAAVQEQRNRATVEARTAEAINGFLVEMFRSIDPDIAQGRTISVEEVVQDAERRLDNAELAGQPKVAARLRTVLGEVYAALGRFDSAMANLEHALQMTIVMHGDNARQTADALERLARVETDAGKTDSAEQRYLQAAEIRRLSGSRHPRPETDGGLGAVYLITGRFEQAEAYFRDRLAQLDRTDGANAPLVAENLSWLGSSIEKQGRTEDSVRLQRQAVDVLTDHHGPNHTQVADALNGLGNALAAAGEMEASIRAHERGLAIKRALLRDRHPSIAMSLNNLGVSLIRGGRASEAEPILREAIRIRLEAIGEHHLSTASSFGNHARALAELGRTDEAMDANERAISIVESVSDSDHLMRIVFIANRGRYLADLGKFDEAEQNLVASIEAMQARFGPDYWRVLAARDDLDRVRRLRPDPASDARQSP